MSNKQNLPTDPDLIGADAAIRRAAINAKKLANQLGTPYIMADNKDSKARTPVFNRTVTLRDAWQK